MAKRKMSYSIGQIDKLIAEIDRYAAEVELKQKKFMERLAMIGVQEAAVRFASAMYDGVNDSQVTLEPTPDGYKIIAQGEAVCFIEFGAGVYHNPSEPYPLNRPQGIVGIGEYGQGKGERQAWVYQGSVGTNGEDLGNGYVKTHGNPASMPMYYATREMEDAIRQVALEVWG